MRVHRITVGFFLMAAALLARHGIVERLAHAGQATIVHEQDVVIPMRDGVRLRADILRPSSDGRFPTLVYRTPYGKDAALKEYTTFTRAV
ncbi:MAG TPA: CocE/NonD family hydrolase, partial [Vicinamibacterales bacterium]